MHFDELLIDPQKFRVDDSVLVKYTGADSIVYIPHGVRQITASAFEGCQGVQQIIVADTVQSIEPYAFSHCKELEAVFLGYSLEVIEKGCFYELAKLREVKLTNRIQRIELMAFGKCHALKTLTFHTQLHGSRFVLQNDRDVLLQRKRFIIDGLFSGSNGFTLSRRLEVAIGLGGFEMYGSGLSISV